MTTQVKKLKNATFKRTVDLESSKSYEFRNSKGATFANETEADSYACNDSAPAENSVPAL
jgi:hypothetical protein